MTATYSKTQLRRDGIMFIGMLTDASGAPVVADSAAFTITTNENGSQVFLFDPSSASSDDGVMWTYIWTPDSEEFSQLKSNHEYISAFTFSADSVNYTVLDTFTLYESTNNSTWFGGPQQGTIVRHEAPDSLGNL